MEWIIILLFQLVGAWTIGGYLGKLLIIIIEKIKHKKRKRKNENTKY